MILEVILIIASLAMLVASSEILVEFAAKFARHIGVSELVIGMTVIAFGTSLPELINAITSSLSGYSGIAIGNVLGANVSNIALILGISAILGTIKIHSKVLTRDGILLFLGTAVLVFLMLDGNLSHSDGLILLVLFAGYLGYLFELRKYVERALRFEEFFRRIVSLRRREPRSEPKLLARHRPLKKVLKKDIQFVLHALSFHSVGMFLVMALSGIVLLLSARLLVTNIVALAESLGVTTALISVTVVSIGTTMPELTVSIIAVRKKYTNLLIGNILGSNIANSFVVLGAAAAIRPIPLDNVTGFFVVPFLILMYIIFGLFAYTRRRITPKEGLLLLLAYAIFLLGSVLIHL